MYKGASKSELSMVASFLLQLYGLHCDHYPTRCSYPLNMSLSHDINSNIRSQLTLEPVQEPEVPIRSSSALFAREPIIISHGWNGSATGVWYLSANTLSIIGWERDLGSWHECEENNDKVWIKLLVNI